MRVFVGVLTGGPGGPGRPLLSWVQVQDLGRAGQSASVLWRRKQRRSQSPEETEGSRAEGSRAKGSREEEEGSRAEGSRAAAHQTRELTAAVSAGPQGAAGDVEDLDLELETHEDGGEGGGAGSSVHLHRPEEVQPPL